MGRHSLGGPRVAAVCAAVLLSAPLGARAEEPPAPPVMPSAAGLPAGVASDREEKGARREVTEEIVVTGSRVPRKDLTTPAPVTVYSRQDLVESGRVTVGEFLQLMPEQANAMNRNVNNGGDGSVRVSLRGAGDHRTLVLLNGRRFVPGGLGADGSVDLTSIPTAAVERIEVLKDGASPIYGSDAIGGVVNVITRRAWDGSEAYAYSGMSSRGDGLVLDAAVTTGRSSERGSVLFSAGYTRQDAIWAGDRGWSSYFWNLDMTGNTSPLGVPGPYAWGSSVTPAGRVFAVQGPGVPLPNPGGDPRIDQYNQLVAAYPSARSFVPDRAEPLGWRPWQGNALPEYGGDQYNHQLENYLVTPSERLSLFGTGEARLGGSARAFFEGSHVNRSSSQKLAPEPFTSWTDGITLSAENQFNPFGVDIPEFQRRLVELGNRRYSENVDTVRMLVGIGGELAGDDGSAGWAWEASGSYGQTQSTQVKAGYTRISALRNALGPSFQDANGWHCGTAATGPIPGCTPIDLFSGEGATTPEQVAAVTFEGTARGDNVLSTFQANLAGPLFALVPARPVELALGYEYRKQSGTFVPDPVTAAGDASTDGWVTTTRGAQDVHEAYAELSIPVLDGRWLAEHVEALAAARVFRYAGFGTDWTWKLGGRWAPVRDATLRGTLSTAFRAPSIWELDFGAGGGVYEFDDPCAGVDALGNPVPVSPWCARTTGDPYPFVPVRAGGNPTLRPETARAWTAGVVLEPRFAPDLSVTVDAWGIRIENTITFVDPLSLCYPMSAGTPPQFCSLVSRDPGTYALTGLNNTPVNAGTEDLLGIDLAARYTLRTPAGAFRFTFDGTWLGRYDFIRPDGTVIHAKGTYDSQIGDSAYLQPEWKFNAGVSWALGGLGIGARVRYVGSIKECADQTGVFGSVGSTYCSLEHDWERRVPAYTSYDAMVTYRLSTFAGRTDVAVGVQNVLDAAPPRIYWAYTATALPADPGYDFVGRYFYARVSHRF